jgi:8-oxo-dGTP pyrophosphatase MutT (NUDIX family)
MMIEVCAGMLDQDNPEQCVIRETEEAGYRLTTVHKVMGTYMSPGAVTEILSTYSLGI